MNDRFGELNQRVDLLTEKVETLTDRVGDVELRCDSGFGAVKHRLDELLKMTGSHHTKLEDRVTRIEDHLGLPHP